MKTISRARFITAVFGGSSNPRKLYWTGYGFTENINLTFGDEGSNRFINLQLKKAKNINPTAKIEST